MTDTDIRSFRSDLRRVERSLLENLKGESECCGISFNECHILMELDSGESCDVTSLAERLRMDKTIISRTVESLVRKKFVDRCESPEDRRKKMLALTPWGEEQVSSINQLMNSKYRELFSELENSGAVKTVSHAARLLADTLELWQGKASPISSCCKGGKG
jgi:DNA-binding MarR family transcriptional regulator